MEKGNHIEVGEMAPDFTVHDQKKNEFKLSEMKGKKILLSFHPLAWTGICAEQMKSLEANKGTFDSLNTMAVGISVDSVPCKSAWAESLGIEKTKLLADFWPHGDLAKKYRIFNEEYGFSRRANIIVDEEQKIAFCKVYEPKTLPDINEIIDFIKNMGSK
jgi:peroxiredoxin